MKNYTRLLFRITNTPLFISENKLSTISEKVLVNLADGIMPNLTYDNSVKLENRAVRAEKLKISATDFAVIDVFDTLQSKGIAGGLSGFTTYESIKASLQSAVAAGYTNILFNIDSPGGEVPGLLELTFIMRELRSKGIFLMSYIDGMAASAAYDIAAATDVRYSTSTSIIGSIGAMMVHMESSIADKQAGRTYTIFRSKAKKALGDSHTKLSDELITKFNGLLDNYDALFNNDVLTSMPQLSLQNLLDMQGDEFIASEALQLNLIDKIVPGVESAIQVALEDKSKKKQPITTATKLISKGVTMDEDQVKTELLRAQTEVVELRAQLTSVVEATLSAERTRVLTILSTAQALKLDMSLATKYIAKGYDVEDSQDRLTDIAETLSSNKAVESVGNQASLTEQVVPDNLATLRAGAKAAGFKFSSGVK